MNNSTHMRLYLIAIGTRGRNYCFVITHSSSL
nr:MAG TPA: hypothetical protein [Caudoviricetes sp.]DAZ42560.1 MAG TPA: hypothetical protein [Caudoviricetes sp.]